MSDRPINDEEDRPLVEELQDQGVEDVTRETDAHMAAMGGRESDLGDSYTERDEREGGRA